MRKAPSGQSASKVGISGSRWARFGPSGLTFDAGWAIFGLPWRIFVHFNDFLCAFVQYS